MNDTKDLLLPPPLALVELTAGKGSGDDGRACKGRRQAGCRSEPEYPAHNHRFLRTSDATGGTLSPQCVCRAKCSTDWSYRALPCSLASVCSAHGHAPYTCTQAHAPYTSSVLGTPSSHRAAVRKCFPPCGENTTAVRRIARC
jgi:hypothetical protein